VLLGIKTLLETEVENEAALEQHLGALLLYAMYEPVNDLSCCRGLSYSKFEDWPTALQPLLKKVFLDRATEHALADSINRLDSVTHEVSKAVMNLYEQNPYPRWEHIFLTENKIRYIDLYPNLTKLIRNRKKFNKHISCLIAGAGTGRQPLWLAANCHDIDVLAFDLSLPSLCYAKRQSMELGLRNIEFCQGDILNLGQLEKKFDVIECSGVLHHMQDPEAGLRILVQRLRSNGLLRLGLYSRIARERTGITAARVDKPNATLEDIRETRAFHLNNGGKLLNLSRDFYTASECRDLLFHVQERQYDIPELKSLLDRNDLEFLGFSPLPKEIDTAFQNRFGPNPDYLDLDNWHLFETENPLIFKGMYQFHCQKRK
jgi:2-polyprenyl-3-methyl-5-hydroxy-6-metoxy-1,4-benzoquinol methylase